MPALRLIAPDVVRRYVKSLNLPPHAGYSSAQFHYQAALRELAGKVWPTIELSGGIHNHAYVVAETHDHNGRPSVSRVVAVPIEFTEPAGDNDEPLPVVHAQDDPPGAWWRQRGYDRVPLLTAHVDGFSAFICPRDAQETPQTA